MYMGQIIGVAFFLLVLFAALTSSISLMETIVSFLEEKTTFSRKKASIIVAVISMIIAIPSSLGFSIWSHIQIWGLSILDFFDFLSNSVIMPIVAFLTCVFAGYVIKPKTIEEEVEEGGEFKNKKMYTVMIKYIAPIFIIMIFVSSVLKGLGFMDF